MTHLLHRSVADVDESELVKTLMAHDHWRERTISLHGIPDGAEPYLEVLLTGLPNDPHGDIDILLVPPGLSWQAVAMQVKRIKVQAATFQTEIPNKLQELARGAGQAKLLADIGFSQVYYFVCVVVDSRANNDGRNTFEGLTPALDSKINNAISSLELDQRVGLVHCEFVQPMDHQPLTVGTSHTHLIRPPLRTVQPQAVTDWVATVVSTSSSAPISRIYAAHS
jgi:hypothetical protein